ncbi:MAG TPA: methyltransferase domain-containing protein [Thermoplasmata archaeon]|nr:methyltransferase domain-containing protein [Thermoplasmata archaeon]
MDAEQETVRARVREQYRKKAAPTSGDCCGTGGCNPAGYSEEELAQIPKEAFLGEGSGNPVRHADLKDGEVVVDLGSGAGVDVFLAARRVGPAGRAIGVDMTPEMLERARRAGAALGAGTVEFREGVIERIPIEDGTVDVILSNCVINLSPDKAAVFREAFRVLRPGGRLVISDIVQERPLLIMDDDCGCVSNAMLRADYLATILGAGFEDLRVLEDRPWREGPAGVDASALTLRATKASVDGPAH